MLSYNTMSNRCSICYTLLCIPTHPLKSAIRYSSINKRHVRRCPVSTFERLISSSRKFQQLWYENDYELLKNLLICDRCYNSIQQLDRIQTDIEQLHNEQEDLLNKIQHNLSKRASIVKGRRQPMKTLPMFLFNSQTMISDVDTEPGEEKCQTETLLNGHQQVSSKSVVQTLPLVGAKRRKCNLAQRLNHEDKFSEPIGSSLLLNLSKQSNLTNSPSQSSLKTTNSSTSEKTVSTLKHGHHDRSNSFSKTNSKTFSTHNNNPFLPGNMAKFVPPFVDPKTGALIAIVSNPHHASLIASQHQQLITSSSSISPSSNHTVDEQHELPPIKQTSHLKKFPCLLCGRDFSNKSNLNRHHSIVHVAIRNFECPRCPKKFKLRQGLKTHMQRCHGVNADEPSFVLQKHHLHNYHHHPYSSSPSFIAQTNK